MSEPSAVENNEDSKLEVDASPQVSTDISASTVEGLSLELPSPEAFLDSVLVALNAQCDESGALKYVVPLTADTLLSSTRDFTDWLCIYMKLPLEYLGRYADDGVTFLPWHDNIASESAETQLKIAERISAAEKALQIIFASPSGEASVDSLISQLNRWFLAMPEAEEQEKHSKASLHAMLGIINHMVYSFISANWKKLNRQVFDFLKIREFLIIFKADGLGRITDLDNSQIFLEAIDRYIQDTERQNDDGDCASFCDEGDAAWVFLDALPGLVDPGDRCFSRETDTISRGDAQGESTLTPLGFSARMYQLFFLGNSIAYFFKEREVDEEISWGQVLKHALKLLFGSLVLAVVIPYVAIHCWWHAVAPPNPAPIPLSETGPVRKRADDHVSLYAKNSQNGQPKQLERAEQTPPPTVRTTRKP